MMRARLFPLALAVVACTPGGAPRRRAPPAADPCLIVARAATPADTVILGIADDADPKITLVPRTPTTKFAFAQAYETLVRVACDGRLVPGLADQWTGDTTGRVWTLTIRSDATFSDGTPVTSSDVYKALGVRQYAVFGTLAGPPPVERITVESDRVLTVRFHDAQRDGPRLLADSYLAVHRMIDSGNRTLLGSGPYVVHSLLETRDRANPAQAMAVLVPRPPALSPVVLVRHPAADDGRDLIDAGVDVMVTSDRRVTEYVPTRPELQATPLGPDRAYALLSTLGTVNAASPGGADEDPRLAALRRSLARDVVRGGAAARGSAWWGASTDKGICALDGSTSAPAWTASTSATRTRRLIYPASDPIAAEIAQRLVALSAQDRTASPEAAALHELFPELLGNAGGPLVTAGLRDLELAASLIRGSDLAYLVTLPRRALDPCAAWRALTARAPWLMPGVPAVVAETGPTLITSPRAPALMIDWDNTIRITGGSPPPPSDRR